MSPVPIILAALASSNRSVGGGFSAANPANCPVPGSGAGSIVAYASGVEPFIGTDMTDFSGLSGSEGLFGAPDSAGWLWEYSDDTASGGRSGVLFESIEDIRGCPGVTITGAKVEAFYVDAVNVFAGLIVLNGVPDDGVFDDQNGLNGSGVITCTLSAAQAQAGWLWDGYNVAIQYDPQVAGDRIVWDAVRWTINYTA